MPGLENWDGRLKIFVASQLSPHIQVVLVLCAHGVSASQNCYILPVNVASSAVMTSPSADRQSFESSLSSDRNHKLSTLSV